MDVPDGCPAWARPAPSGKIRGARMTTRTDARSITHEHLLGVVLSELASRRPDGGSRLLDVGCGDGALLTYFGHRLPELAPHAPVELHGFDVRDHGVQEAGFMAHTLDSLAAAHPAVDWNARVSSIADADPWPYAADSFDVVVSNQVLEHVRDHDRLFAETRRVLKDGGYAVHLFPLKHYVWEGHLLLPFVHRIGYFDLLRWYISCLSRLGLGKFRTHEREFGTTLPVFAERHADLLLHYCNYLSYRQVLALAKRHGLRPSFRYTKEFYWLKLRTMLGRRAKTAYHRQWPPAEWLAFMLLRQVSSITLFLEKRESFRSA
jgi:SAM-dependent methyltransferase